jgi:hypothetical protein
MPPASGRHSTCFDTISIGAEGAAVSFERSWLLQAVPSESKNADSQQRKLAMGMHLFIRLGTFPAESLCH